MACTKDKKGIVCCDTTNIVIETILEVNEKTSCLRKKKDFININMAELLKCINLALKCGLQDLEVNTSFATACA